MNRVLECVPNFSEGRDPAVYHAIADAMRQVDGARVLDVDPGASTNRTVITLAGEPAAVIEAAFKGIQKASELIDMAKHEGAHPRMGATDVCPLIPIAGITNEEAVQLAHTLAKRVADELGIPTYLYERAAQEPKHKSLASIRAGEYEGFAQKILKPEWKPDYGPAVFNAKSGATVIGVRDFLIAYNVNLNTQSVRRANSVAFDVREAGRIKREGNPVTGTIVRDAEGNPVREPGTLKAVRGIGWYIEEYGIAQVSMNLTNLSITSLHEAFQACVDSATARGMRVTGSELVGLVPKKSLVEAGRYFLKRQNRSTGVDERTLIHIAVKSLGLDELGPFDPDQKVIEYKLGEGQGPSLVSQPVDQFTATVASESPAPGGGSVSAVIAGLGSSLGGMVANLSANKRGWDDKVPLFSERADALEALRMQLLSLVDEDSQAYEGVLEAMQLPKATEEEKTARQAAIERANQQAAEVPLRIMETALEAYPHLAFLAENGNPNAITDVGVGALATYAGVQGAGLNVQVNLSGVSDVAARGLLDERRKTALKEAKVARDAVMTIVERVLAEA